MLTPSGQLWPGYNPRPLLAKVHVGQSGSCGSGDRSLLPTLSRGLGKVSGSPVPHCHGGQLEASTAPCAPWAWAGAPWGWAGAPWASPTGFCRAPPAHPPPAAVPTARRTQVPPLLRVALGELVLPPPADPGPWTAPHGSLGRGVSPRAAVTDYHTPAATEVSSLPEQGPEV